MNSCIGYFKKPLSSLKTKAEHTIDQEKAIRDCLICKERIRTIEAHHSDAKSLLKTTVKISKCKQCRETLNAIVVCAKMGHVYEG